MLGCLLSRWTSRFRASMSTACVSSLTLALLRICLARLTNCSVLRVSWHEAVAGLMFAMIMLLALPPKLSCSEQGSCCSQI